jgi:hypothetical protein
MPGGALIKDFNSDSIVFQNESLKKVLDPSRDGQSSSC